MSSTGLMGVAHDTMVALSDGTHVSFDDLITGHSQKQDFFGPVKNLEDGSTLVSALLSPMMLGQSPVYALTTSLYPDTPIKITEDTIVYIHDNGIKPIKAKDLRPKMSVVQFMYHRAEENKVLSILPLPGVFNIYNLYVSPYNNFLLEQGFCIKSLG